MPVIKKNNRPSSPTLTTRTIAEVKASETDYWTDNKLPTSKLVAETLVVGGAYWGVKDMSTVEEDHFPDIDKDLQCQAAIPIKFIGFDTQFSYRNNLYVSKDELPPGATSENVQTVKVAKFDDGRLLAGMWSSIPPELVPLAVFSKQADAAKVAKAFSARIRAMSFLLKMKEVKTEGLIVQPDVKKFNDWIKNQSLKVLQLAVELFEKDWKTVMKGKEGDAIVRAVIDIRKNANPEMLAGKHKEFVDCYRGDKKAVEAIYEEFGANIEKMIHPFEAYLDKLDAEEAEKTKKKAEKQTKAAEKELNSSPKLPTAAKSSKKTLLPAPKSSPKLPAEKKSKPSKKSPSPPLSVDAMKLVARQADIQREKEAEEKSARKVADTAKVKAAKAKARKAA